MTLQLVKDELEDFFIGNQMLHSNCAINSIMLVWHWGLKPYLLLMEGHTVVACPHRKLLLDPTIGCFWESPKVNSKFLKELLKGKKPDYYLSWYKEDEYRFWWDYSYKYNESVKRGEIQEIWDIPLKFQLHSFTSKRTLIDGMGKFSDYIR